MCEVWSGEIGIFREETLTLIVVNKVLLPEFGVQETRFVSPMTRASQWRGQSNAGLEADAELWILNG